MGQPPKDNSEADGEFEGEREPEEVRPAAQADAKLALFDEQRSPGRGPGRRQAPGAAPPAELTLRDQFFFHCHRGLPCWNQCCHGADVTLTPADILRLSRRFGVRPGEFVAKHTVPAILDRVGMPVAKLKMGGVDGKGACGFLSAEGCTVYSDRPAACRYYPLGLFARRDKDATEVHNAHFMVKEAFCCGHQEARLQTVAEYRKEQGVEDYEELNRGWIEIMVKLAQWQGAGGPQAFSPSRQTKQMFYMVSTDVDVFRRFVFDSRFLEVYDIDPALVERLRTDDELLLKLGFDWLKSVLFKEPTLAMKESVLAGAIAVARETLGGA
jgi:Fe-S-cluster containining protein